MNRSIVIALVLILQAFASYAAPDTNASSEELQLLRAHASEYGAKIDASEEEINESFRMMKEGTSFFLYLLSTNALPETAFETVTNSVAALDPPSFAVTYPAKVRVDVRRKDGAMHVYSLSKHSLSNTWVVADAWEEDADKRHSPLKLPTEADQMSANEALPAMMHEWNSENE